MTCGQSITGQTLYLSGTDCLASCPKGFYGRSSDNTCQPCISGCSACTDYGLSFCSECTTVSSTAYYKHIGDTVCSTSCPNGQYILASIPNICQQCSSNCLTCSGTA